MRESLKAVYFDQYAEVLGGYIGDRKALENFAGAGTLNSLHFPMIEFDAPASLFAEEFESARQKALATLIKISEDQHVPLSFEGSHEAPGAEQLNANRQAVRLMIMAMLESEQGQKEKALKLAIQSCSTHRATTCRSRYSRSWRGKRLNSCPTPPSRRFARRFARGPAIQTH